MLHLLKPIFTTRFLKFCVVGASGVLVNMGCLTLFARLMGMNANLAAALAIEVSIVTNFLVNELWTFRDRRAEKGGLFRRMWKFHLVSLVGAALQWMVFVGANCIFASWMNMDVIGVDGGWFERVILHPVTNPPAVGNWMYLAQLVGIAVATLWNFFANFYWTWKHGKKEAANG